MSSHSFVHVELSSKDHDTMKSFYGGVFGWEFQDFPEMNYVTFSTGNGGLGGGFNPVTEANKAGTVVNYINCDDIEQTRGEIIAHGGKILDVIPVPSVGLLCFFFDPSGNMLALLQPEMTD